MQRRKIIAKTGVALALVALCAGAAQAQLSSRSRIGDLFGIPMRPYAGLQVGVLSFYGDVRPNTGHNWLSGKPGAKFDFMLEIGSEGMLAAKLSFMYGVFKRSQSYWWDKAKVLPPNADLYSEDANLPDYNKEAPPTETPVYAPQFFQLSSYQEGNLNFRTNLFSIGLQGEYRIQNIPGFRSITPYVSTGFNLLIFNPYGDFTYSKKEVATLYETERLQDYIQYGNPPNQSNPWQLPSPPRDEKYETQLKTANLYGEGNFSGITVGFPLELGFDFRVMPTVNIRLGTSFTFTLTDYMDGVSGKVARAAVHDPTLPYDAPVNRASRLQVNSYYDFFAYSYVACYIYLPFL